MDCRYRWGVIIQKKHLASWKFSEISPKIALCLKQKENTRGYVWACDFKVAFAVADSIKMTCEIQKSERSVTSAVLQLRPKHAHSCFERITSSIYSGRHLESSDLSSVASLFIVTSPLPFSNLNRVVWCIYKKKRKKKKRIDLWRFQREGFWNGMLHFDDVVWRAFWFITAWCSPSLWRKLLLQTSGFLLMKLTLWNVPFIYFLI